MLIGTVRFMTVLTDATATLFDRLVIDFGSNVLL